MRKRKIRKLVIPTRQINNLQSKPISITKRRGAMPKGTRKPVTLAEESSSINTFNSSIIPPSPKSNRLFIIGGGPSINKIDLGLLENEDTMCINASINYVKNPTYFVTMDYSYFDTKRNINTVDEVVNKAKYSYFILNTNNTNLRNINGKITDIRHNFVYDDLYKFSRVISSSEIIIKDKGFSINSKNFANGENSGFCGIQLATILGYEEIYLIGFDLDSNNKETHFHKKYSNSQIKNKINDYKNNLFTALSLFLKVKTTKISTVTPSSLEKIISRKSLKSILKDGKVVSTVNKIKEKPYIIVSYYTTNTPYEKEADKLIKSLQLLRIPYDVVGVPNLGDWQSNTRFKAKFMQDMLIRHKGKSIVWVDSDAVVHSYPDLFDSYSCDVAVRWQDFRWRKNECLSGTIYLANNPQTLELCRRWEGNNISEGPGAKTFEQWNLGKAIEDMRNEGKIKDENLPPEYTMIFDSMRQMYPNITPVIEHFQASRKLRNKV